jgi:hypothetical protein
MAMLQNAAARANDGMLLDALDKKKEVRWGTKFEVPEVITQNNLPQVSVDENIKLQFVKYSAIQCVIEYIYFVTETVSP